MKRCAEVVSSTLLLGAVFSGCGQTPEGAADAPFSEMQNRHARETIQNMPGLIRREFFDLPTLSSSDLKRWLYQFETAVPGGGAYWRVLSETSEGEANGSSRYTYDLVSFTFGTVGPWDDDYTSWGRACGILVFDGGEPSPVSISLVDCRPGTPTRVSATGAFTYDG